MAADRDLHIHREQALHIHMENQNYKEHHICRGILVGMLMYGKEASNRKQEIDRQHYTIPNQRPKDKHCGKI